MRRGRRPRRGRSRRAHCSASGARASCALSAQTTSSQISTPGSATLAPAAVSVSQVANVAAPKTMPIAIAACTNSSARRTTPTWQTSNADSGPRRRATASGAMTSKTVVPKPVERDGASPEVGPGAGATKGMLIGDKTPPIESSESWRDTCSGLSPTDARPWGPCCARDDADPCGSPRLARLRQLQDTCQRTSSRKNPRPGRRCSPSRRASSSSATRRASTFDKRLWRADIAGSLAHAAMLADRKVITPADLAAIQRGLAHDQRRDRARRLRVEASTSRTST